MRRAIILATAISMALAACSVRTAILAPRRSPTAEHLAAANSSDCTECHDPIEIARHKAGDSCIDCHGIDRGK